LQDFHTSLFVFFLKAAMNGNCVRGVPLLRFQTTFSERIQIWNYVMSHSQILWQYRSRIDDLPGILDLYAQLFANTDQAS